MWESIIQQSDKINFSKKKREVNKNLRQTCLLNEYKGEVHEKEKQRNTI